MPVPSADRRPIGIFDSGMGGISVLGEALRQMPNENYVYFGDAAHAPYGEKRTEEIVALSERVLETLMAHDVKGIVIACNTATSAAASELRKRFTHLPIIGMEPALKPAVHDFPNGTIVVMATEVTLREKKFAELMRRTADQAKVIKLPCPSLVRMVERSVVSGEEANAELRSCFSQIENARHEVDAVVLGCTHFVFLRKALRGVLGERVQIFDGNSGTIHHLRQTLEARGLLTDWQEPGKVLLLNSLNDIYNQKMLDLLALYEDVAL